MKSSFYIPFLAVVLSANTSLYATPVVTGFSPILGNNGTVITVTGSGFTGTTNVYFEPTALVHQALFSVITDSSLSVTIPTRDINDSPAQAFLVRTGTTATLAMADDAIQVTTTASYVGLDNYFWVHNGGTLTGVGGSALIYVDAGGVFNDTGGGVRIVVVEAGGTVNGGPGGVMRVYAEPGSNITLGAGGTQTLISLSDVSLSLVPDFFTYVPEPSTLALGCVGLAGLLCLGLYPRS